MEDKNPYNEVGTWVKLSLFEVLIYKGSMMAGRKAGLLRMRWIYKRGSLYMKFHCIREGY